MNRLNKARVPHQKGVSDPNMEDLCILCGGKTGYRYKEPIQMRLYYFEGAGQLCPRCFHETYEC